MNDFCHMNNFNLLSQFNQKFYSYSQFYDYILNYNKLTNLVLKIKRSQTLKNYYKNKSMCNTWKKLIYYKIQYICEFYYFNKNKIYLKDADSILCYFSLKFKFKKNFLYLKSKNNHSIHEQFHLNSRSLTPKLSNDLKMLKSYNVCLKDIKFDHENVDKNSMTTAEIKKYMNKISQREILLNNEKFNKLLNKDLFIIKNNNITLGYFFQNEHMKLEYKKFGQIIFFDGTYNIFKNNSILFIISIINGENKTMPICFFSTIDETFESLCFFIDFFKSINNLNITKLIMTDKDFTERKTLKLFFKYTDFRLCYFHIMKSMNKKIKELFPNEQTLQKKQLKLVKKIIFSNNKVEYLKNFNFLKYEFKIYYLKNWHNLRHEFIQYYFTNKLSYNSFTNNRAEGMNSVLKKFINKKKYTETNFFININNLLYNMKYDYSIKISKKYLKEKFITNFNLKHINKNYIYIINYLKFKLTTFIFKKILSCKINFESACNCKILQEYNINCFNYILINYNYDNIITYKIEKRWLKYTNISLLLYPLFSLSLNKFFNSYISHRIVLLKNLLNYQETKIILENNNKICLNFNKKHVINTEDDNLMKLKKITVNLNSIKILTKKLKFSILNKNTSLNNKKYILEMIINQIDSTDINDLLNYYKNT